MSTYNEIYTLHKIQRKVDIYNSVIPCEKICEDLFWFFLQVFAGSFTSSFAGLHRFFTGWQVCCRFAKGAPNHLGWFGLHQYIGNVFHKRGFSRTDPRNRCPARKGVCCFYPQTIWNRNHKFVQNLERSCQGKHC